MKLYLLLIAGIAFSVMGCAEKEQAVPEDANETQLSTPAAEAMAEDESAEAPAAEKKSWESDSFLEHMHTHAEQLDRINFALDDGDLEAAMTPAFWLSRHEAVSGIPAEWQPFLAGMREAASAVENAPDIATAQAAAGRITQQCQACHAASGVAVDGG